MTTDQLRALTTPTRFDHFLARYFPKWAASRVRARHEFAFEAARSTRLRQHATRLQGPEDFTAFPDRMQLIRQVRDLEQNFGLFQGIIDKVALYAFGELRYQSRTGNERQQQQIEDWIAECADNADLSGRHHLEDLVPIAFKSELRDGDIGHHWRRDAGYLKLQGIESDRIGGMVDQHMGADDWMQGIHVDLNTGAPIEYEIYRRTKGNIYVDPKRVSAADVMLLLDPRRVDQYRGITPFAPICDEARDLKEVLNACLIGTKFENMHGAIGYTPSGQPLQDPSALITSSTTDANGVALKEQELRPGMIQWAPSTAEMSFIKSDRPSGTFQTYIDLLVRLESIALNLPFSFIYSLMGLTGPAVRADLQTAHRTIRWHQKVVTRRLLDPWKNVQIMEGIARGKITYSPTVWRGKWFFPAAVSIDAGRDSAAKVAERNAGLRSADSIFAEDGEDAAEQEAIIETETRRLIARAKKINAETGVDLPVVLTLLGSRSPNAFLFATPGYDAESASDLAEKALEPDAQAGTTPSADKAKRAEMAALIKRARTLNERHTAMLTRRARN